LSGPWSSPPAATRLAQRDELGFNSALGTPLAAQALDRQVERILLTEAPHQLADRQRRHVVTILAHGHAHEPVRGERAIPQARTSRHI
jgi:hypothetical protein